MVSEGLKNISDSEENSTSNNLMESGTIRRTCADCSTTRTPLWRGGPAGPRSLCNACGIRHRKKSKRAQICTDVGSTGKNKRKRKSRIGEKGVMRLLGVGGQMRRKLREEEEAAVLLMAMSYGVWLSSGLV